MAAGLADAAWPPGASPFGPDPIELLLSKEDFKFNAAHFVVHERSRERLHGHNYRVALLLRGAAPDLLQQHGSRDGYLFDFGELKRVMRGLCAELNERFLLPTANPFMVITTSASGQVDVAVNDGSRFSFPAGDVLCVPLSNVSVEELAGLFARRFLQAVGVQRLRERRVTGVTLTVAENCGQEARFSVAIAPDGGPARPDPAPPAGAASSGGEAIR